MRAVALTRRGIGFLVAAFLAFLVAAWLELPSLLAVTGLVLGLFAAGAVYVLVGQAKVRVERTFAPEVVPVGGVASATVHVTNLSVLPTLEAAWSDRLPNGVSGENEGVLPALGGSRGSRSRVRVTYGLTGLRRGRHPIGPLSLEISDPFGLLRRGHGGAHTSDLVVLPKVVPLWPLTPHGADDSGASRPAPQNVGLGEDDVIARSYLPGDAMKRLHWKATAHRGELMVRQEERQVNPRAALVLDRDARSFGTARDRQDRWEYSPLFEWAVTATASIASHLVRVGYSVQVRVVGGASDRLLADGGDDVQDVLVDLAVVEPGDVGVGDVGTGERTTFVVLGCPDVERAHAWVAALSGRSTVLALVGQPTREDALDVLSAARWRCVPYDPRDDVAEAWTALGQSRVHAPR